MTAKLIESEKGGWLKNARLMEAEDGTTAVEALRRELQEGRQVDFILMDYVMVKQKTKTNKLRRMGYPIHTTLSSLEQVRMHGPEAASIMRNELNYAGTIIGR